MKIVLFKTKYFCHLTEITCKHKQWFKKKNRTIINFVCLFLHPFALIACLLHSVSKLIKLICCGTSSQFGWKLEVVLTTFDALSPLSTHTNWLRLFTMILVLLDVSSVSSKEKCHLAQGVSVRPLCTSHTLFKADRVPVNFVINQMFQKYISTWYLSVITLSFTSLSNPPCLSIFLIGGCLCTILAFKEEMVYSWYLYLAVEYTNNTEIHSYSHRPPSGDLWWFLL